MDGSSRTCVAFRSDPFHFVCCLPTMPEPVRARACTAHVSQSFGRCREKLGVYSPLALPLAAYKPRVHGICIIQQDCTTCLQTKDPNHHTCTGLLRRSHRPWHFRMGACERAQRYASRILIKIGHLGVRCDKGNGGASALYIIPVFHIPWPWRPSLRL